VVLRILILALSITLAATSLPTVAFAQAASGSSTTKKDSGTRHQLTMIVFAGISGAILGLSTLSFYGRPQDKLNNIWGGFAVGIIIGAIYSAYSVASQPRQFSKGADNDDNYDYDRWAHDHVSYNSQMWQDEQFMRDHPRFAATSEPLTLGYTFRF
jgi:uncharacterized membrane protein YfcA